LSLADRAVAERSGVMRGLDPRIHPASKNFFRNGWIAGSSPAMTDQASNAQDDSAS
jgi:hypothetical protein